MTITMRIVSLVDKLKLQKFFVEKDNKAHFKFAEFSPARLEETIDKLLRTKGNPYQPNQFEKDCLKELDF